MIDSNSTHSIHLDGKLINIEKMSVDELNTYLVQVEEQKEKYAAERAEYLNAIVLGKN